MIDRLLDIEVSALSDSDRSLPLVDRAIRPLVADVKMAGPAFTVTAPGDLLPVYRALGEVPAGAVLVIDTQGTDRAVLGEIFTTEAHRRGVAGIVVDGWCRDVSAIRRIGLPFYARGAVPNAVGAQDRTPLNGTVQCGGVEVEPGAIVFGDDDGILIAAADRIDAALPGAESIIARERRVLAALRAGEPLHDHLKLDG